MIANALGYFDSNISPLESVMDGRMYLPMLSQYERSAKTSVFEGSLNEYTVSMVQSDSGAKSMYERLTKQRDKFERFFMWFGVSVAFVMTISAITKAVPWPVVIPGIGMFLTLSGVMAVRKLTREGRPHNGR